MSATRPLSRLSQVNHAIANIEKRFRRPRRFAILAVLAAGGGIGLNQLLNRLIFTMNDAQKESALGRGCVNTRERVEQ